MNILTKLLAQELETALKNVKAGNSECTDEELAQIIQLLASVNKGGKRISKLYACEKILHCSVSTFDNYVREGIIPPGRKEPHFKELSWTESDFVGVKLKRIRSKYTKD